MAAEFEVSYFDLNSDHAKVISKLPIETTSISDVTKNVEELTQLSKTEFELYLGLKTLDKTSEELISKSGVNEYSRIYAIKNKTNLNVDKEIPDIDQARSCLSRLSAMMRGTQKKNITKTLQDDSIMQPIIAATPNIKNDQIALDFLKKPSLFAVVINPSNTLMLLKEHPSFLMVCLSIWHVIATEALQKVTLDESDDDMELDEPSSQQMQTSTSESTSTTSTTTRAPIITPEQLAAAVQSAIQGAFSNTPGTSGATQGATSLSNTQTSPTSNKTQKPKEKISEEVMQTGLKQLREMGLMDETMCRKVLEATKGNVQAAITILFS